MHYKGAEIKQYSLRGAPFSKAGLNGTLMKKKKQHTQQNTDKKMVQLSITKVRKSHLGLDLKSLFKPNANFIIWCSLLRSRGSAFQILALLNLT